MSFRRMTVALGVMALMAPGLALASHTDGGWQHHEGMELLHGVNLTDAQKQQVQAIMQADKGQMMAAEHQMHALHDQLSSALLSGAALEQLTAMQRQEDRLREQMDSQMLAVAVQVRGVLTADQLSAAAGQHAKLAALHDQERAVEHPTEAQ